jgi:hypothetical protein
MIIPLLISAVFAIKKFHPDNYRVQLGGKDKAGKIPGQAIRGAVMSGFQYCSQRSLRSSGATLQALPLFPALGEMKPKPDPIQGACNMLVSAERPYAPGRFQKFYQ